MRVATEQEKRRHLPPPPGYVLLMGPLEFRNYDGMEPRALFYWNTAGRDWSGYAVGDSEILYAIRRGTRLYEKNIATLLPSERRTIDGEHIPTAHEF